MRDYTPKEAAEYMGVKPETVRAAVRRGQLVAWKRGGFVFIDGAELKRYSAIRRRGRPLGCSGKRAKVS